MMEAVCVFLYVSVHVLEYNIRVCVCVCVCVCMRLTRITSSRHAVFVQSPRRTSAPPVHTAQSEFVVAFPGLTAPLDHRPEVRDSMPRVHPPLTHAACANRPASTLLRP